MAVGYRAELQNTNILFIKPRFLDSIIMEATGTELQPNNLNRDDDFCLREPSKPHICSSNDRRKWVCRFPYDGALHKVVSLMHIAHMKTPIRPFSRHMSKLPLLFPQRLLSSFSVPCCSFCSAFLLSFRNALLTLCSHLPHICKYGPLQGLHHLLFMGSFTDLFLLADSFLIGLIFDPDVVSLKYRRNSTRYHGVTSHKIKILFIIFIIMGASNPKKEENF